jgi:hypothetical protein
MGIDAIAARVGKEACGTLSTILSKARFDKDSGEYADKVVIRNTDLSGLSHSQ